MAAMQLIRKHAGIETTVLLERRSRAGQRSLKQGQLEVVGRGRRQLDSAGGPTSKGAIPKI
jgi:hypothetical protein